METLLHPRHAAQLARAAGHDARTLAKLLLPAGEQPSPLKGDQRAAHRVAWADPVSLRSVKATGRALDATVNDVLVAAVAGAVGRHLAAAGAQPDELHAMVPFNLRPLEEPLPRDLGNRFGLVLLGLPVGIQDPVARLSAVREQMLAIKDSHEGALAYGILGVVGRTPAQVEERLVDFFSAKATMVLTNVPGPRAPGDAGRHSGARRPRVGTVLGQRRDERQRLQLRREGDRRVPHRRRSGRRIRRAWPTTSAARCSHCAAARERQRIRSKPQTVAGSCG